MSGGGSMGAESSAGDGWHGPCAQVFDHAAVPTLVVSGADHEVVFANRSATRLLADHSRGVVGTSLHLMGHADDPRGITGVLESCYLESGRFEYLRFRFNPDSGPSVSTEMVITGCGDIEGVGPSAVVQIRNISLNNSLAAFMSHVADVPDGDTLLYAMRWGPLAALPVHSMCLNYVHPQERQLRLLGAFQWTDQMRREYAVSPLRDSHPGGAACVNSETIWLPLPKLVARFPLVARPMMNLPFYEDGEAITMPVTSRGTTIGSLFVLLKESVQQTAARLDQLTELRHVLAPWILLQRQSQNVPRGAPRSRHFELSDRELTILRLVEEGFSNNNVAEKLGYSEATVRADLSRLYKLLGANGRREVVRKARESGLYEA